VERAIAEYLDIDKQEQILYISAPVKHFPGLAPTQKLNQSTKLNKILLGGRPR
jgi:hypothetical protein